MRYRQIHLVTLLISLVTAVIFTGCSSESEDDAAVVAPQIDPRFATADALVAHFNSLTATDSIYGPGIESVFYAENDKQREMLDLFRCSLTQLEIDRAMLVEFDESFDDEVPPSGFELAASERAVITQRTDRRAQATFEDWTGDEWNLHLVEIGGRWWISAYTFEFSPFWKEIDQKTRNLLPFLRVVQPVIRGMSDAFSRRIRAKEFKSPNQARAAFIAFSIEYGRTHPHEMQPVIDYVRAHPEQREMLNKLGLEMMAKVKP